MVEYNYADFQIIEQPQEELIAKCGESVTLHVSAVGSGQLSYEWKKDQQKITDRYHYDGIDTTALTITSFSDKYQGDYLCVAKNNDAVIESKHSKVELSKWILIVMFSENALLAVFIITLNI